MLQANVVDGGASSHLIAKGRGRGGKLFFITATRGSIEIPRDEGKEFPPGRRKFWGLIPKREKKKN